MEEYINSAKTVLNFPRTLIPAPTYSSTRRHLASLYLNEGNEIEAIYNLTESHGCGLRQLSVIQNAKLQDSLSCADYVSFEKGYALNEANGMLERLKEMPSEWTIVQLTREFDQMEPIKIRAAGTSPVLKGFHLTRLPCGSELEVGNPVTVYREWPESAGYDLIEEFWKIKKQISTNTGASRFIRKIRNEAAGDVERYCREIGEVCIKEWLILFLGTLCDQNLSSRIRKKIDNLLKTQDGINKRQRYLTYLLADGAVHLSDEDLEFALEQIYPDYIDLRDQITNVISEIKDENPNMAIFRRHPVILIVDDHLDHIPWENFLLLRRHPISRVPSLHFAHALYKIHSKHIKNGLREVDSKGICYYVLNPSGDLRSVEQRLAQFIKTRFPSWIGIIGKQPSEEELVEALTTGNAFIYCGHGSGCQYLSGESIQRLKVKPVQLLFGCSSVALKDHGGFVEMTGDFLEYAIAGSGCTTGMLWPVTSHDVDKMTLALANIWLPGDPVDIQTLEKIEVVEKEPELLRAVVEVRKYSNLFTNGAAFIARGIPIKLV